jgi:hypothetical protein
MTNLSKGAGGRVKKTNHRLYMGRVRRYTGTKDGITFQEDAMQGIHQERKINTLALDIEGTLLSHASTMIPRPGLFEFLTFCKENFERVVFFSFVEEERGKQILNEMVKDGHMPEWVLTAEYVEAKGGRPGAKNLSLLGVDPEQAYIVDDQPQVLPREQLHRLVQVSEFKAPYPADDCALKGAMNRLRMPVQT